jgi:hypothetical protein
MIDTQCKPIIFVNNVNHLIDVTVRCGVLFEVRTGFLNIIYMSFGFKGLRGRKL